MDVTTLAGLYEKMVDHDSPIELDLQVRMVEHLLAGEEFAVLAKFAARPDVCGAADGLLASCVDTGVLSVWAARPGRSADEVLARVNGERRVAALAPFAKAKGLPEGVYAALAARDSAKLSAALFENDDLPVGVKVEFLDKFLALASADENGDGKVRRFAGQNPDLLARIVASTRNSGQALVALEEIEACDPCQLPTAVSLLVDRIEDVFRGDGKFARRRDGELLMFLALRDLDVTQIKTMLAATRRRRRRRVHGDDASDFAQAHKALSPAGRKTLGYVNELSSTTSVSRAKDLVKKLLTGSRSSGEFHYGLAVSALARNTVLPAVDVLPFMEEFTADEEQAVVARWLALGDIATLAVLVRDSWAEPEWFVSVSDPLSIIRAAIDSARDEDDVLPPWVLEHRALTDSPEITVSVLPWKKLSEIASNGWFHDDDDESAAERTERAARIIGEVRRLLLDQLGADPQKWEIFASLSEEFEGTLPELLYLAANV